MKASVLAISIALAFSASAHAQDLTSTSGSSAGANSGSASQDASNQSQTANNAGIGSSTSGSTSGANSNSASGSTSASDQGQTQGQTMNQGQSASNQQGVAVSNTFNSTSRKVSEVRSNAAVPLAASSSFSSDYCGGTASGGASLAPIGISIGGAAPTFDKSCQALRRAERFGQAAANAANMGQTELAGRLMSLMIWSICTSDSKGVSAEASTAQACAQAGLLGVPASPSSASVPQQVPVSTKEAVKAAADLAGNNDGVAGTKAPSVPLAAVKP